MLVTVVQASLVMLAGELMAKASHWTTRINTEPCIMTRKGTWRHKTLQCGTVHSGAVRHCAVQHGTAQHGTGWNGTR